MIVVPPLTSVAALIEFLNARIAEESPAATEAKRQLLENHAPVIDGTQSSWAWFEGSESESELILRLLALLHADHPDYREEWRPS